MKATGIVRRIDDLGRVVIPKEIRGAESLDDIEELESEMIDRFGEYPEEVASLFQIAEMKVYALLNGVEQIKQTKQEVTILINEEVTNTIDGSKIFQIGSQFGRNVTPGMEGPRLKIVIKIKDYPVSQWLNIAFEMVKGVSKAKKGHENPVN